MQTIEKIVEDRLEQLRKLEEEFGDKNKALILKKEEDVMKRRRSKKKEQELLEANAAKNNDLAKKAINRNKPTVKKIGRPDMDRSKKPEKHEKPKEDKSNSEEEKINKYFQPDD